MSGSPLHFRIHSVYTGRPADCWRKMIDLPGLPRVEARADVSLRVGSRQFSPQETITY